MVTYVQMIVARVLMITCVVAVVIRVTISTIMPVKCPAKCLSCTSKTQCTSCTKGFYGKQQCLHECSDNCRYRECDINGQCKYCVNGMYGDNCNIKCEQKCTICDRSTGGCLSCETDTYLYNNQCESCPKSCAQCTSNSRCTECVVGHWGDTCGNVCSNCQPETPCRQIGGDCLQSCVDGMSGWWCTSKCSAQCSTCERSSPSRCIACVTHKYGEYTHYGNNLCDTDCPQNCLNSTCIDKTGECTFGCIDGYYGNKCKCPPNCNCDRGENCISCKEGFGHVSRNCECTSEKCIDTDCSACTSLNYFVHDKTCCTCQGQDTNCERCTTHVNGSYARCTKCKTGFFPPSNQNYCAKCPISCKDKRCDSITGECFLGCMAGHWGTACENNCTYTCLECDQHNGTCAVCEKGKYSPNCSKSCSQSCKSIDNVSTCTLHGGACVDGCRSTNVHGSHCEHSCSIHCSDEQCDWQTEHCLHGCTDHHYGNICNNTCSQTCATPKTGSRCHDTNGTCVDGCMVGYYGEMCENQCSSNCVNSKCEQFTGSCRNGCRGRYKGDDCMMENISNIKKDYVDVTTIVIGVGIGLFIAIIIAVGVIVLKTVRKRRIHRPIEPGGIVLGTVNRAEHVSLTNFPNQTDVAGKYL